MTDEKAKEILDFLAKKLNGSEFMISEFIIHKTSQYSIASIIRDGRYVHLFRYSRHFEVSQCDGYAEILRKMLQFSNKGYDIETLWDEIFLHKGITLEQILVEMDLETNDRQKSKRDLRLLS